MKLLSLTTTKDSQQKEQTLKILRIQEIEELARKANANLAKAEADFHSTLALHRSKWAVEEQEHQETLKVMDSEVQALERRKQQALIPIAVYKQEADKIMEEARDMLKYVREKEELNDYLQQKLEQKLSDVADRENLVAKEENRQKNALLGIATQQEQIKKGMEDLSRVMAEFHEKQTREEASLLERKKEVSMAEISFGAKVDKYKRDMEALRTWERQLTDERETLKRAFERK